MKIGYGEFSRHNCPQEIFQGNFQRGWDYPGGGIVRRKNFQGRTFSLRGTPWRGEGKSPKLFKKQSNIKLKKKVFSNESKVKPLNLKRTEVVPYMNGSPSSQHFAVNAKV